jgi:hypothetical protein
MKKKIVPVALIACLLINVECSEDALERSNPNSPTESGFYKTERELIAGSNAMYATLQKLEIFNSHLPYAYDLRSDEYGPTFKTGQDATLNQLYEFTVLPDNNYVLGYWRYLFEAVFRSNLVLDKLAQVTDPSFSEVRKKRIEGEAKFVRAFAYFYLTDLFGDVPLFTNSTEQKKFNPTRTPRDQVISQVINDFKDARNLLPTPAEWGNAELGRATKGAAGAFLGKLYLHLGRYAEAKAELAEVVNSGVYGLIPDYARNFDNTLENNRESVFEIQFSPATGDVWTGGQSQDGTNVAETHMYSFLYGAPQGAGWNLQPSVLLFNAYEPGDPRKEGTILYPGGVAFNDLNGNPATWTAADMANPTNRLGSAKYISRNGRLPGFGGPFSDANLRIMRYADVLLLYAEALNETDGPMAALPFINQVRDRVKMPAYPTPRFPAATKDDVFKIIMHERMVELGGEQKRWMDLVRWDNNGKINIDNYIRRSGFDKTTDKLLPVPQSEIDINPNLRPQNPGY